MSNVIIIKECGNTHVKEGKASGVITPGDFLERDSSGNFKRQSVLGQQGPKLVALSNVVIGGGVDTDYAADDNVKTAYVMPGDEVYAFLPASADAVTLGDSLIFNGDGTVSKGSSTVALADGSIDAAVNTAINASHVIATALESVDNSAGVVKKRIKIEIV